MTQEEHREIVKSEAEGRLLVGVDRAAARQFFTQLSVSSAAQLTGEHLYLQFFLVKSAFVLANVLPLVAAGFAIAAFHWWAALVVPASFVLWILFFTTSSHGGSGLALPLFIVAAAIIAFVAAPWSLSNRAWLLSLAAAIFLGRFMYVAAASFLRSLVLGNHQAFECLADKAIILRHA